MWLSLIFVLGCFAHRDSLGFKNSCMGDFGDSSKAFILPNAEVSWALFHYYDCHSPAVWFEFKNPEDNWNKMYFGAGVIIADRFKEARVHAMLVGPGLPTSIADVPFHIPQAVLDDPNMTGKVLPLSSPQDQSNCNHLTMIMQRHSYVDKNGRCTWTEQYTQTDWWWVLDHDKIEIPVGGEKYFIVAWEANNRQAKVVFGMGFWEEDFVTQYPEIKINQARHKCPDVKWFKDFSEKNEMPGRSEALPGDVCAKGKEVQYDNKVEDNDDHDHKKGEGDDHDHKKDDDHDHKKDDDHDHKEDDHDHKKGDDHDHLSFKDYQTMLKFQSGCMKCCNDLGGKYTNGGNCFVKKAQKVRCRKIKDMHICGRVGCTAKKKRKKTRCQGEPEF